MSLTYNQKRLLLLALYLYRIRRKKRRIWVQPYLQKRTETGQGTFYNLLAEMRLMDIDSFVDFFRVTPRQFENLLSLIGNKITPQEGTFREPISARDRLAVTLRFLASGDTMKSISCMFRISSSVMTKIVARVCSAIGETLAPLVLPTPNASIWEKVAKQMNGSFQFPNCIGAIGGKIVKQGLIPGNNKDSEKIVFLAVCDAEHKFLVVDIAVHTIKKNVLSFKSTNLGKAIIDEKLDLPPPIQLSGVAEKVPCVFAGDFRFPLKWNLLKPYHRDKVKDFDKEVFNYRLSRCKNLIENAFRVMSTRFHVFSKPVNARMHKVQSITMATACLHNYLMSDESLPDNPRYYCPEGYCDYEDSDGILHEGAWRSFEYSGMVDMCPCEDLVKSVESAAIRDTMKTYFGEAGAIHYQTERVTAFNQS